MNPLIERRVRRRGLVRGAESADMWGAMAWQIAQLLNEARVQGKCGVDPTKGIDGLCLDS